LQVSNLQAGQTKVKDMPTIADFSKATTPTKGDWVAHEQGEANEYVVLTDEKEWVLAVKMNGKQFHGEQLANLRLMVAAPEMLKALERMIEEFAADENTLSESETIYSAFEVIQKAKGNNETE
jgi:hypothetical protein